MVYTSNNNTNSFNNLFNRKMLVQNEILYLTTVFILSGLGLYLAVSQYWYAKRYDNLIDKIEESKKKY